MSTTDLAFQARRYKMLIDSTADGILLLDSVRDDAGNIVDFRIAHCNAVGARLARFPETCMGNTLLTLLPHLHNNQQYLMHKRVVETGEPVQFETSFRDEDGQEYGWFLVTLQKMEDGVLSRFVDITAKKKYEEAVEKQANLLDSILNASQHGVVALTAVKNSEGAITDFTIINANERFANMLKQPRQTIVGKSYLQLLHESKKAGLFKMKCDVVETRTPVETDVFYHAHGINGWFTISIAPLGSDGVVQTVVDITDSRKDKDRLAKIINTSRVGIVTLVPHNDREGNLSDFKIALVNKALENFLGRESHQLAGRSISAFLPQIKLRGVFLLFKKTFETGVASTFDFHLDNGPDLYFSVRADKLENELLVTFTNFTPLRKMQLRLQRTIQELKRSNASLEEFTSAASHDLKEPIRKINILLSHLKLQHGAVLQNDSNNTFQKLETATRRMFQLVDDLLEYSHLAYEKPPLEQVDLNEKVSKVLEDLDLMVQEKKAVITVNPLPAVNGYSRQLEQLFQNLLINALKYAHLDKEPVIEIRATMAKASDAGLPESIAGTRNHYHVISVSDNGIGFDQKYADRIFNVFERLHGNYQYKGSGVGLAIARKVVLNHNGAIRAASIPGEGATFYVYLPA